MTTEKKPERWISDIVGALTDPIIVMPGGWGDSLPDWIKPAITIERFIENIKHSRGEEPTGTDAEAMAYLFTASLEAPMGHDWSQIYLYIASKTMQRHKKVEIPEDIRVESINRNQQEDLERLKRWIYNTRCRVRQERDRADRRERKEADMAEREALQPALFDL